MKLRVKSTLLIIRPELAEQWHPTKNGILTPERVTAGSGKKVWWKCPKGSDHEWEAAVYNRVNGRGCPFCAGYKTSVTNSLASIAPEIAQEWHQTKNGKLTPNQVVAGSAKKAWWKCPKGCDHEWEASIEKRVNGRGCPFCRGLKTSVTNSLASIYPEIAKEWHPTKNKHLTPEMVVTGSHKKVWWKCPKGSDHEWEASIEKRVNGRGCPFCAGRQVSVKLLRS